MLCYHLVSSLLRSLRYGDFSVKPRRCHKPLFSVFKLPCRTVHHVPDAVCETDRQICSLTHCDIHSLLRNELRLGRHYRFTRSALRKLILCTFSHICVVYSRDDKLLHKLLYEGRLTRPHRAYDTYHQRAVRSHRDIFVNRVLTHNISLR